MFSGEPPLQLSLSLLQILFLHVQEMCPGPVHPDTAFVLIEEINRVLLVGHYTAEHPVQQAHRPVIQRKIEDQQTEDRIADH